MPCTELHFVDPSQSFSGGTTSCRNVRFSGQASKRKVRIARKHILKSAFKVFELYGSSSSMFEAEYLDEVGIGLGPKLELCSCVLRKFARRDLMISRDTDATFPTPHANHVQGLFPLQLVTIPRKRPSGRTPSRYSASSLRKRCLIPESSTCPLTGFSWSISCQGTLSSRLRTFE